ncbi:Pogo transposable element with ZNF domain protein, partial [Fragariocoptes setiger]
MTEVLDDDDQCYEEAPIEPVAFVEEDNYPDLVSSAQLERAALQMRGRNMSLINSSLRTYFTCFDDMDLNRFEAVCDHLICFRSNGSHRYDGKHVLLRPVSKLWPTTYEHMTQCLSHLDSYLINSQFKENPAAWLLNQNLCRTPICKQCQSPMVIARGLTSSTNLDTAKWQCMRTEACSSFTMPVHRPSFFHGFESISLKKLLFAVYFWAVAANGETLYYQRHLNLSQPTIEHIWRRIQNVCRTVVESQPPIIVGNDNYPAELVTVQFGKSSIVCAKNPTLNIVRLGLHIEGVSTYSFVELTESWFAPNSTIRIAEDKFLALSERHGYKIRLVSRRDMMSKNNRFDHDSAFGYLITQLAHVFKDFDTSTVRHEGLKLVLAEMQWRELYGTTPYDSFRHIIKHMATYGERSDWYSEASMLQAGEETIQNSNEVAAQNTDDTNDVWAEAYFYAYLIPKKKDKVPQNRSITSSDLDVRFQCHLCQIHFSNYQIVNHHIEHVEKDRREDVVRRDTRSLIECTHCFRPMTKAELRKHKELFTSDLHLTIYGCRICCTQMPDRLSFLQHMRRLHFESETPYTCPLCRYSVSSHREIFVHFREEHKSEPTALCPFCLRSFTIKTPENMSQLSKIVNQHINMHYAVSRVYSCSNCCLSFLNDKDLSQHKREAHNPLRVRNSDDFELKRFIVSPEEERHCVRAMPMELFVANKKPNLTMSGGHRRIITNRSKIDNDIESISLSSIHSGDDSSDDEAAVPGDEIIHVRGIDSSNFLEGGEPNLVESTNRQVRNDAKLKKINNKGEFDPKDYSSEKIKSYLERMPRADSFVPNKSVILTPDGLPTKCIECMSHITSDHFVAQIKCNECSYSKFWAFTQCAQVQNIVVVVLLMAFSWRHQLGGDGSSVVTINTTVASKIISSWQTGDVSVHSIAQEHYLIIYEVFLFRVVNQPERTFNYHLTSLSPIFFKSRIRKFGYHISLSTSLPSIKCTKQKSIDMSTQNKALVLLCALVLIFALANVAYGQYGGYGGGRGGYGGYGGGRGGYGGYGGRGGYGGGRGGYGGGRGGYGGYGGYGGGRGGYGGGRGGYGGY